MSKIDELKAFAIEADNNGDVDAANAAMNKIEALLSSKNNNKSTIDPVVAVSAEIAAGANNAVTDLLDFLGPDQINNILKLSGSKLRVPTLGGWAERIGATQGGFVDGKAGDVLRAAGEAIPMAIGGGMLVRQAASKLPMATPSTETIGQAITKQMAEKTTVSGDIAVGAGAAAGSEQLSDAGVAGQVAGGIVGGIGGAGIKAALHGTPQALKAIFTTAIKETGSEELGGKLLAEQMVREGLTPADIERRLVELGSDAIPADAAITFARMLRVASNKIPRLEGRAARTFTKRQENQAERIMDGFDDLGGMQGITTDDVISRMHQEYNPAIKRLYENIRGQNILLGKKARKILDEDGFGKDARDAAEKTLQTRALLGDKIGNIDIIDATKQQLDDQIGVAVRSGEKNKVRDLVRVKNALLEDADRTFPDYKKARDLFAGKAQLENAADLGKNYFKLKAGDINNLVKTLSTSEKKMFKLGVKDAIMSKMDDAQTNANLVTRLFGKRGEIKKLKSLFGSSDELAKFSKTLEKESRFLMTRRAAESNSSTVRQANDQQMLEDAAGGILDATTSPLGAIRALKSISDGLSRKKGSEDYVDALAFAGDLLLDKGGDPARIRKILEKGNTDYILSLLSRSMEKPKMRGAVSVPAGIISQDQQ